jgi:predicted DNA-binding transcriptional regulator YafY
MANTSSRTLRLLSLLQHRRDWPGPALAGRLGVSVRTLRRDVDRLRDLGYPVEAQRGVDGGYHLAAGAVLPPLVLDDDEAVALAVGLQAAVQSASVVGIEESSLQALAKVAQVMPARLRRRVESVRAMTVAAAWGEPGPGVDPAILTSIALACRDGDRLVFEYSVPGREPADRLVDPHRLVLLGRRWYLVAYDRDRHDWRTFRLDRLSDPRTTGERFPPRPLPASDAAAFVREGIGNLPAPYNVEAVVHAPAPTVAARVGSWCSVTAIDDGHCLLRMTAHSLEWPSMTLGATGADFEICSPDELVASMREWSVRFERATTGANRT